MVKRGRWVVTVGEWKRSVEIFEAHPPPHTPSKTGAGWVLGMLMSGQAPLEEQHNGSKEEPPGSSPG